MAGSRQPTDLIVANGRKHLSKAEETERREREVSLPVAKTAKPPKWLQGTLKKEFRVIGKRLIAAGLYTELDGDTLARYLIAQHQWLIATQAAERALIVKDQKQADAWGRIQDRYFKQALNCANSMGLTVSSRCRLVVPPALVNAAGVTAGDGDDEFTRRLQARQAAALAEAGV